MNILVVAATIQEIEISIPYLAHKKIPYLITGVGMVAATYALAKALQTAKVDLIIQVGIGGILHQSAPLGSIYRIVEDHIFELGAEDHEAFIPIEKLGFGQSLFREQFVLSDWPIKHIPQAIGITVNKVHGQEKSISRLRTLYSGEVVESMEGVSAFFVASQEKINVLQFRAISNYIEPRNRAAWQIGLAVKNLNEFLQELLQSLS
ncbi:futalosine hydrolase [Sphingobacterium oryzagri]|uniref:Futalosine hydrolase n=1 Tax=Sphingobacterium oryzagri TaxID=3025669 RepID=A0ABY7WGN8_9SPHI|nr:futalosine hydrolase [Sphingobacterium sp. KACC 22765]WDF68797.1 futalosine hydrolase [Sphingobacterium sp. KACC 22765]